MDYQRIKSHIIKYGLQRANRFRVSIPLPDEVQKFIDTETDLSGGILPSYVTDAINAGLIVFGANTRGERSIQFMCRATELPGTQFSTETTSHNGHTLKYVTGIEREGLNFTFQLSGDMIEKRVFDVWKSIIVNEESRLVGYPDEYTVDIEISALDIDENVVYTIFALDSYPTTIAGVQLNKMNSDMHASLETSWSFTRLAPTAVMDSSRNIIPGSLGNIIEGIKNGNVEQAAYSARMLLLQAKSGDFTGEAGAVLGRINDVMVDTVGFSATEINKAVGNLRRLVDNSSSSENDKNSLSRILDNLI